MSAESRTIRHSTVIVLVDGVKVMRLEGVGVGSWHHKSTEGDELIVDADKPVFDVAGVVHFDVSTDNPYFSAMIADHFGDSQGSELAATTPKE